MVTVAMPSAEIVFDTLFAYQRSAALKSALDLDLFSLIDDSATSTQALATRSHGIRTWHPDSVRTTSRPSDC
jgi:hypothetical protein